MTSTFIDHITDHGRHMEATEKVVATLLISVGVLAVAAFIWANFIL